VLEDGSIGDFAGVFAGVFVGVFADSLQRACHIWLVLRYSCNPASVKPSLKFTVPP